MIVAVDPGTTESAFVLYDGAAPGDRGILPNPAMLARLAELAEDAGAELAIEMIASYGMPVGRETFETVYWIGRFAEAWMQKRARLLGVYEEPARVYRAQVKLHLCHSSRAKDANVRQALLDRWGGKSATKKGGPLHGIASHVWAALGVAVTYGDLGRAAAAPTLEASAA